MRQVYRIVPQMRRSKRWVLVQFSKPPFFPASDMIKTYEPLR